MNNTQFRYEGKWALVTGASSGIGKAFAYELASRGANLILASRSKETLDGIAQDVGVRFKVETEVVSIDLAAPDSPERLFSDVKALNRTVRILINNAGVGSYGKLHENSLEGNRRQILFSVSQDHFLVLGDYPNDPIQNSMLKLLLTAKLRTISLNFCLSKKVFTLLAC